MSVKEIEQAARDWYGVISYEDVKDFSVDAVVDRYAEDGVFFDSFPMRFDSGEDYERFTRWAMEHMIQANAMLYQLKGRMLGDNNGLVTAHDSLTAVMSDGRTLRMMGRVTFVFEKQGSEWKMVHLHASPQVHVSPFDIHGTKPS